MLDLYADSSKSFRYALHHLLDIVVEHFMEVGSNLSYEEIYASVFPLHKQEDEEYAMGFLKSLQREIRDDYSHRLTSMKEYVLYNILLFVYEGSEDGFLLNDEITNYIKYCPNVMFFEDEFDVLYTIKTPNDLIGICFDDLDFLEVHKYFEAYKKNPYIVNNLYNVDLDYHTELMPNDILTEYNELKDYMQTSTEPKVFPADTEESFYNLINELVDNFNHYIIHKKGHTLINNKLGEYGEKEVQVLFDLFTSTYLKDTELVITREVDTGRGTVDFYISKGKNMRGLIEIKLGSHNRFAHGLKYQLPVYLLTENIKCGFFILICYSEEIYQHSNYLHVEAKKLSKEHRRKIYFKRINASGSLATASNINSEAGMGFSNKQ
ncbi:hypothetical protein ACTHPZ_19235 [Bacillus halotolerans]|uniref:hypothetical protein n=1 Tax=Bacillus halotolerans TaxID=260554 RepID=UPI003F7C4125